jgi:DNA-binding transcriptional LysR family regulator
MPLALPVPDLVSLDLLQSVAELGSIRQAAQAHSISQPAASMRLRSLERTLGLELLDRSSGRAHLTPAGFAVVRWSDQVLDGIRSLVSGTKALQNEGRTQLRIAASMTVAEYLVPAWIDQLRRTEPGLGVSLQMGNSLQVAETVKQQHVDLGFIEGRSSFPDLKSCVVEPDDLVVIVAPSHSWARRRRPLSAAMLAATPLVLREIGSGTREVLETALAKFNLTVTPQVEMASTTAIKAVVESGVGPAVVSRLATRTDIEEGRLVVVPIEGLDLRRSIRAVWVRNRPLSEPAKCFLAQIGEVSATEEVVRSALR